MDMAGQCRLRDNSTTPNTRDEVVLADDPVAVPHQINQKIEDLRLDRDQIGAVSELAPVDVKAVFAKANFHDGSPLTRPPGLFSRIYEPSSGMDTPHKVLDQNPYAPPAANRSTRRQYL